MPLTRVAALYDIHGNLPALEAVLEDVASADVDAIVVGGDVVPGPDAARVAGAAPALESRRISSMGNGDREVIAQREPEAAAEAFREAMRWNAGALGETSAPRRVAAHHAAEIAGVGDVLFCHATPRNDTEIFTRRRRESTVPDLATLDVVPVVVCGHTHMQFDRTVGARRVINAGSVGMPFGEPGAYWLLLGPQRRIAADAYDLARGGSRSGDRLSAGGGVRRA